MALNRLNSFNAGYNAYNIPPAADNLKVNNNPAVTPELKENTDQNPPKEEPKKEMDLTVSEVPVRENASIENVAISFGVYDANAIDLFGEKGLASEDMRHAISGMQKDHLLHEYQYFVGGKDLAGKERNIIAGTEDGIVIRL
ncbi:hypothetical protein [Butyrivibrio sp. MC2021]|uniref:hypothetical protein n=1 Tax=Butyrivibrio sp. MC2021 TaxID=1408306 RepID=UPI00047B8630|nr:hypothetical protein [Butyrivibrio sp. MC2021]